MKPNKGKLILCGSRQLADCLTSRRATGKFARLTGDSIFNSTPLSEVPQLLNAEATGTPERPEHCHNNSQRKSLFYLFIHFYSRIIFRWKSSPAEFRQAGQKRPALPSLPALRIDLCVAPFPYKVITPTRRPPNGDRHYAQLRCIRQSVLYVRTRALT